MSKHYAYLIMVAGKKVAGGTESAVSMDEAAQKVAKRHGITREYVDCECTHSRLMRKGKSCSLGIWANEIDFDLQQ